MTVDSSLPPKGEEVTVSGVVTDQAASTSKTIPMASASLQPAQFGQSATVQPQFGQSLVTGQQVEPTQFVSVIAPTDLAAGYRFNVDAGGTSMMVQVPEGGVRAGQQFNAIVVSQAAIGIDDGHNIPSGRWRDGLCDCCAVGCCHPMFWLALCCKLCALGQVQSRMKLNCCASPINLQNPGMSACRVMVFIVTVKIIVFQVLYVVGTSTAEDTTTTTGTNADGTESTTTTSQGATLGEPWGTIRAVLQLVFIIFLVVVTLRTRGYIRQKYKIPEQNCNGCEDCCCAFWCTPCTICQMARHTADYRRHPASCCSKTGLGAGAPEVV